MAIKPLPKWAMQRYALLWNKFKDREFTFEKVSKLLKERDPNLPSVILSYLRKYGWLTIKLHPDDARKRIYQLISPDEAMRGMIKK